MMIYDDWLTVRPHPMTQILTQICAILKYLDNRMPLGLTAPPFSLVYAEHLSRTGKYVPIHMKS